MARILQISSNLRGDELEIEEVMHLGSEAEYAVRVKGDGYSGAGRFETAPWLPNPVNFFDDLSAHWAGWQGEKSWQSAGSTLQFKATRDGTGHICLVVCISELIDPYSVTIPLYFDAGQLDELAKKIRSFFTAAETA